MQIYRIVTNSGSVQNVRYPVGSATPQFAIVIIPQLIVRSVGL